MEGLYFIAIVGSPLLTPRVLNTGQFDPSLYESCAAGEKDRGEKKASFEERALAGWKQIDAMATSNR